MPVFRKMIKNDWASRKSRRAESWSIEILCPEEKQKNSKRIWENQKNLKADDYLITETFLRKQIKEKASRLNHIFKKNLCYMKNLKLQKPKCKPKSFPAKGTFHAKEALK